MHSMDGCMCEIKMCYLIGDCYRPLSDIQLVVLVQSRRGDVI